MEPFLIAVTFLALAMAALMGVVAWKLLREKKDRTAARVEALEALAFEGLPDRAARASDDEAADIDDGLAFDTGLGGPAAVPAPIAASARIPAASPADRFRHERPEVAWGGQAEPLFEPTVATTNPQGRRLLAIGALVLALIATLTTMRAWQTPELAAALAVSGDSPVAQPIAPANGERPVGPAPLELLSLRHEVSRDGTFTLTGLAQNPSRGQTLNDVVAVVYLFDGREQYFATGRTTLATGRLSPGEETPFVITVPRASTVNRYRVGFRREDGGVVAHVDARGQPLEGTTGDVTDEVAVPGTASPASMPRRSEG